MQGEGMKRTILILCYFFSITRMSSMDVGPTDPNIALIFAMTNRPLNLEKLADIDFLFKVGADPNFHSTLFKTTPLMRAVRETDPRLVDLVLAWGGKVNVQDKFQKFPRDFNFIYTSEVISVLRRIVNSMYAIDNYNACCFATHELNCDEQVFNNNLSARLRDALWIDKQLESRRAYSDIRNSSHPLIQLLNYSPVRRALMYVINNDFDLLPSNIRKVLEDKRRHFRSSCPF
jgi:hypothetical protein